MVHAIAWVDAASKEVEPRPWAPAGLALSATVPAFILSPRAAPLAASWVRDSAIDVLHVFSRKDHHAVARYVANIISGAAPGLAVTIRPTHTTGVALMAVAGFALAQGHESTRGLAAMEAQAARTPTGVWLKRVSRLSHPNPSFGQHLRSLFPSRTGYVATLEPEARVFHRPERLLTGGQDGILLVAGDPAPAQEWLNAAYPGVRQLPVPSVVTAASAYGSAGVEFAHLIPGPDIAQVLVPGSRCPVCGSSLFTDSCPLCHVLPRQKATA